MIATPAGATPLLIALSGLPGAGKSTLATAVAHRLGAVHLRIDTIEDALLALGGADIVNEGGGYAVAYALAADNLRLGLTVVADSVNPVALTRTAWRDVAARSGCTMLSVHVVCSDVQEHERRIRARPTGTRGSDWEKICKRVLEPAADGALIVDTAPGTAADLVACVVEAASRSTTASNQNISE